jgi:[CysO sulfur-carrier protein]-S-L-cysteine hydrolase
MEISPTLVEEIVEHARAELPNECCGMVGGREGVATTIYRARNAFASPLRFDVDPRDLFEITERRIPEAGEELVAIYHSHPNSEAYPSQTDINLAEGWPDPIWLICSLADPGAPVVRGFAIRDGGVREVGLDAG